MDANVIRQEVETTYEKVKSLAGWTVDKNVVLTITSYYVTSEREFDAESLSRAMDELKSRSGWLSPLRGNLLPMLAAFLDQPGTDIDEEVERLFAKQQVLKGMGFRNTIPSVELIVQAQQAIMAATIAAMAASTSTNSSNS